MNSTTNHPQPVPNGLQAIVDDLLSIPVYARSYDLTSASTLFISLDPLNTGIGGTQKQITLNNLASCFFQCVRGNLKVRMVHQAPPLTKSVHRIFPVAPGIASFDESDRMGHYDWDTSNDAILDVTVNPTRIDSWFTNTGYNDTTDYQTCGRIAMRRIMNPVGLLDNPLQLHLFLFHELDFALPNPTRPYNPFFSS